MNPEIYTEEFFSQNGERSKSSFDGSNLMKELELLEKKLASMIETEIGLAMDRISAMVHSEVRSAMSSLQEPDLLSSFEAAKLKTKELESIIESLDQKTKTFPFSESETKFFKRLKLDYETKGFKEKAKDYEERLEIEQASAKTDLVISKSSKNFRRIDTCLCDIIRKLSILVDSNKAMKCGILLLSDSLLHITRAIDRPLKAEDSRRMLSFIQSSHTKLVQSLEVPAAKAKAK